MRYFLLTCVIIIYNHSLVAQHHEYPRPQLERAAWTNLNGEWEYAITNNDKAPNRFEGKIIVPFPIESKLSGVQQILQPSEYLWYKRTIKTSTKNTKNKTLLHFGAVDYAATIFINGQEVGSHKGGYQSFSFDVTKYLNIGNNELIVRVQDPSDKGINPHGKQVLNPEGIMYTPSSGIWQTVWMEIVPANYITGLTITPDVDKGQVKMSIASIANSPLKLQVAGKTITGASNTQIIVSVPHAKLWSPDDPYLYNITITMGEDKVKSYVGMRKIEIKKDKQGIDRIFLNNQYVYNLGTLDQGFWPDGLYTAPSDEALAFDIKAIKAMGFNTIRKHIKIEPQRWYYYADKLGMLVWQDMVNPGNDTPEGHEQFEKECTENIKRLYNHPSIITWVLFNEKWGQYDQARLTKWMKQLDPTRLINGHSGEKLYVNNELRSPSPDAWVDADMTDVHAYPMPGHIEKQPGKAMVIGEFGGVGVPVAGHLWDDMVAGWGYNGVTTPQQLQQQYQQMIDSLKILESKGLSASIYTQPFDVESEQNGLITYDRKISKLPVSIMRKINGRLWSTTKNTEQVTKSLQIEVADTLTRDYASLKKAYHEGKRDSASLRLLIVAADAAKDSAVVGEVYDDYLSLITTPTHPANVKLLYRFTTHSTDKGFSILMDNSQVVNRQLGPDKAESKLTAILENDIIKPFLKEDGTTDWRWIEDNAVKQYGDLGQEIVWQTKVFYALNHRDWEMYLATVGPWLEKYGRRRNWISAGIINGIGWGVFQLSDNPAVLKETIKLTAAGLAKDEQVNLLDTHANLLYKSGQKSEALQWQQKALALAPNDAEIQSNYKKMQQGIPTW